MSFRLTFPTNNAELHHEKSPINFPAGGNTIEVWFSITDDTTPIDLLDIEKVLFSNKLNDFSEAEERSVTLENESKTHAGIKGENVTYNFRATIQPKSFWFKGETIFIRIFVKDEDHSEAKEIPGIGSENFIKTYAAFTIQ